MTVTRTGDLTAATTDITHYELHFQLDTERNQRLHAAKIYFKGLY